MIDIPGRVPPNFAVDIETVVQRENIHDSLISVSGAFPRNPVSSLGFLLGDQFAGVFDNACAGRDIRPGKNPDAVNFRFPDDNVG